jgi:hypothetical protein
VALRFGSLIAIHSAEPGTEFRRNVAMVSITQQEAVGKWKD